MVIDRPALRYPGGKFILSSFILDRFPSHDCYVEPFGGGASLLLQKRPSPIEVYNDLDEEVVNFFEILRTRSKELIEQIELTPYARVEHHRSYQPTGDKLESARRLYVRLWQGHGNTLAQNNGWRYVKRKGHDLTGNFFDIEHLHAIAKRLKRVQIECDSFEKVIARYDTPETLFFVDPPYVRSTRKEKNFYRHEMSDEQHEKMARLLLSIEGKVILCGYESDLYDRWFGCWQKICYKAKANGGGDRTEVLWLSPNCEQKQLSLFDLLN